MKKLICILSLVFFCSINQSKAQLPASLSDIKWTETKHNGFLIANDGMKTEVVFDVDVRMHIGAVEKGEVNYSVKGSSAVVTSIGDEYKGFQIGEKIFERIAFVKAKVPRKVRFMRVVAKGKIDAYEYIHHTSIEIGDDGKAKEGNFYYVSIFLRNNDTKVEVIANEGAGIAKAVELMKDNEAVMGDYKFRQYDVLETKEGVVKRVDLLKMVNDYNAAK